MNTADMERLVQGIEVKAEKIRILHDAGISRSDIAKFMGVAYQHVHNVLKRSNRLVRNEEPDREVAQVYQVKVERDGRIVLPKEYVVAQGITAGDTLICRDDHGNLLIMSRNAAIKAVSDIARQRMPEEAALLEALIGPGLNS